jgi:hypothetical protein
MDFLNYFATFVKVSFCVNYYVTLIYAFMMLQPAAISACSVACIPARSGLRLQELDRFPYLVSRSPCGRWPMKASAESWYHLLPTENISCDFALCHLTQQMCQTGIVESGLLHAA